MRAWTVGVVTFAALDAFAPIGAERPAVTDPATLTGDVQTHVVRRGDTLRAVGARFGVDVDAIVSGNGISAGALLRPGQTLEIDNRHVVPPGVAPAVLLVNVPQRMAFLQQVDGRVHAYPVAVGRAGWQTPIGPFTVLTAERDPTWDVPPSILEEARRAGTSLPARVPPGPDNPLGRFWLGLSLHGVGIHGTNAPSSIYGAVTHGCIRMHPDDIARVFASVAVGTAGRTVYAPVLLAEHAGEIFLEVHPDVYRRARRSAGAEARDLARMYGLSDRIDWKIADRVATDRHGVARAVGRAGLPGASGGLVR